MLNVRVDGGTDAGTRPPFLGKAAEWQCSCEECCGNWFAVCCGLAASTGDCCGGPEPACCQSPERKVNPGYLTRCMDCGDRRPHAGVKPIVWCEDCLAHAGEPCPALEGSESPAAARADL